MAVYAQMVRGCGRASETTRMSEQHAVRSCTSQQPHNRTGRDIRTHRALLEHLDVLPIRTSMTTACCGKNIAFTSAAPWAATRMPVPAIFLICEARDTVARDHAKFIVLWRTRAYVVTAYNASRKQRTWCG